MVHSAIRLLGCIVLLTLVVEATAQRGNHTPPGAPARPLTVACQNSTFPTCYYKYFLCPDSCPRSCSVDCATCQPVCSATPSPPRGRRHRSPPPPPPRRRRRSHPPPPNFYSPPPPSPLNFHSPPPPPPPVIIDPNSPPTPSTVPTPSPPPAREVSCGNANYPTCYRQRHYCPSACPDHCEVDCVTCSPVCNCNRPGAICQDPRFIGGDGITFYFHGKKDRDFCVVSDSNLHINAHFIGKRNHNMGRDFTWVQSLGILFDNHKLSVAAKKTAKWNNAVDRIELSLDGDTLTPLALPEAKGTKWESDIAPGLSITRSRDTNAVVIEVEGNFKIKATVVPITEKESKIHNYGITEEDCFAHLDLSFKFYSLSSNVNGVLGQTYASKYVSRAKMGIEMPILGGDGEFASSTLFSTDCATTQFVGHKKTSMEYEFANLNCASGMDGLGVICKR